MKKLIIALGIGLISFGCTKNSPINDENVVMEPINTVALGEVCGGSDRIKCQSGLECNEKNPTKTGQCIALSAKDIECSEEKKPVCGLKNNNKNGYLNACEADRHGAKVLYEGFCKTDESVAGNCEAEVVSMGNCEAFFTGVEFDGNQCQEVGLSGCSADIPFPSMAECQNTCSNTKAQEIAVTSNKLQVCPDEKINNLMPGVVDDLAPIEVFQKDNNYYIYQGERREIDEFDADWVKANCDVQEQNVY